MQHTLFSINWRNNSVTKLKRNFEFHSLFGFAYTVSLILWLCNIIIHPQFFKSRNGSQLCSVRLTLIFLDDNTRQKLLTKNEEETYLRLQYINAGIKKVWTKKLKKEKRIKETENENSVLHHFFKCARTSLVKFERAVEWLSHFISSKEKKIVEKCFF